MPHPGRNQTVKGLFARALHIFLEFVMVVSVLMISVNSEGFPRSPLAF